MRRPVCGLVALVIVALGSPAGGDEREEPLRPAAVRGLPEPGCLRALRTARIEFDSGDADAALVLYGRAVTACPGRLEPHLDALRVAGLVADPEATKYHLAGLVRILTAPERPLQIDALERAIADPLLGRDELVAIRGRLDQELGRPGTAEAGLTEAGIRLRRLLAVAASRLGDAATARAALEPVLRTAPSPEVRWICIDLDRQLDRWPQVVDQLEAVIAEDPVMGDLVRLQLVEAYARTGRLDDAITTAAELAAASGGLGELGAGNRVAATALLDAAWALRASGRDGIARQALERAVALAPDLEEASEALELLYGPVEARQERARREERELARASDPQAWLEEGTERLAVGDDASAIELLRQAADGLPEHEIAWYNLGLAAVRLELWSEASAAFERAVALGPDNLVARLNLGTATARAGDCERALVVLDELVAAHPEIWQAHYWRWSCRDAAGDAEGAAEALAAYEAGRSAHDSP